MGSCQERQILALCWALGARDQPWMPRLDTPLSIEVPAPGADRPPWGKVGIVAAAGFVFGILWPRLTSTRIAPNPPSDAPTTANMQPAPAAAGSSAPALSAPGLASAMPADQGAGGRPGAPA